MDVIHQSGPFMTKNGKVLGEDLNKHAGYLSPDFWMCVQKGTLSQYRL